MTVKTQPICTFLKAKYWYLAYGSPLSPLRFLTRPDKYLGMSMSSIPTVYCSLASSTLSYSIGIFLSFLAESLNWLKTIESLWTLPISSCSVLMYRSSVAFFWFEYPMFLSLLTFLAWYDAAMWGTSMDPNFSVKDSSLFVTVFYICWSLL